MKDRIYVDAKVLVYAPLDDSQQQTALNPQQSGWVLICSHAFNKFTCITHTKAKLEWQEIIAPSNAIQNLAELVSLDLTTHNRASPIAASYGYSFYASLIIAATIQAQCNLLTSKEMQHLQTMPPLIIPTPFAL